MPELITDMSEPVNSVTMNVLQPLWNESSLRMNNCLAYSGIGPIECALKMSLSGIQGGTSHFLVVHIKIGLSCNFFSNNKLKTQGIDTIHFCL